LFIKFQWRSMDALRGFVSVTIFASMSVVLLAGCGAGPVLPGDTAPISPAATGIRGHVHGGQQPVAGSTIQLWSVGILGYASAATPLIPAGSYYLGGAPGCVPSTTQTCYTGVVTDALGDFDISNDYDCTLAPDQLVYVTAKGGNPGLAAGTDNSGILMMTALGPCSGLDGSTFVEVNEATTIASAYALAQFTSAYDHIGSYATATVGLTNAFATVHNLVDTSEGLVPQFTPAGYGWVPQTEINTLANILASCVNTASSASPGCESLFNAAKPSAGTKPATVLDAALDIALNPANNASTLFGLGSAEGPFLPALPSPAPPDFTIAVLFAGQDPGDGADADTSLVAIDADGNVWSASSGVSDGTGGISEQTNLGVPFPNSTYNYHSSLNPFGIAIDLSGNAWVAATANLFVGSSIGELEEITPGGSTVLSLESVAGAYFVDIAIDAGNHIWVPDQYNGLVYESSNAGTSSAFLSPSGGFITGGIPIGVAPDASGNVWVTNDYDMVAEITPQATVTIFNGSALQGDSALAVDKTGNLWITNLDTNKLVEFSGGVQSNVITPASSIMCQGSIPAVDGANHIWVADDGLQGNLSEYTASGGTLSPTLGFQGPTPMIASTGYNTAILSQVPSQVVLDQSGNLWIPQEYSIPISPTLNANVVEFIGLGAPTIQPLAQALKSNQVGVRPGTP
jgi:streptogramin lyase